MATSTPSTEDVTAILRRMDAGFMANAKLGDAGILVESFYAEDACVLPPGREIVRGRRALVRMWKGIIAAGLKDLALNTTEIDVHGDLAYGIGQYHMTVEPVGGARAEEAGKYLVVYKKQTDGAWKAVADMFSPNS